MRTCKSKRSSSGSSSLVRVDAVVVGVLAEVTVALVVVVVAGYESLRD